MNSYKSDLYYNVVLKDGSYLGYKATWVGDGGMLFQHENKPDIRCYSKASEWMKDCWERFLKRAES